MSMPTFSVGEHGLTLGDRNIGVFQVSMLLPSLFFSHESIWTLHLSSKVIGWKSLKKTHCSLNRRGSYVFNGWNEKSRNCGNFLQLFKERARYDDAESIQPRLFCKRYFKIFRDWCSRSLQSHHCTSWALGLLFRARHYFSFHVFRCFLCAAVTGVFLASF